MSKITIGMATCGRAAGGDEVYEAFETEIKKQKLPIELAATACIGLCSQEVIAEIEMDGKTRLTYGNISPDTVPQIIEKTIKNGEILKKHALFQYKTEADKIESYEDVPFIEEHPIIRPMSDYQAIVQASLGTADGEETKVL